MQQVKLFSHMHAHTHTVVIFLNSRSVYTFTLLWVNTRVLLLTRPLRPFATQANLTLPLDLTPTAHPWCRLSGDPSTVTPVCLLMPPALPGVLPPLQGSY